MNKKLAPICLFTFNRLSETQQTIAAFQKNYFAPESELFVFSDGPKNELDAEKVNEVRQYLHKITGFKKVTIFESPKNKGLANSIISGVTKIISEYGRVIVLEDDLITSPNFLNFMNQALDFYKENDKIYSISGYTMNMSSLKNLQEDYYFGYRASSWGWGTWQDRWNEIDWEVKDYSNFNNSIIQQIKFMRGGSDMPKMLKNQMNGKIDSWAIRWCFNQFIKNKLTVYPSKSKIINIGINDNATHTKNTKRFDTILDSEHKVDFIFSEEIKINPKLIKEFKSKFSIKARAIDKINKYIKLL